MTVQSFIVALTAFGLLIGSPTGRRELATATRPAANDSVVLTMSAHGDARPRGALHTLVLSDAVDPGRPLRLIAASVLTRADTFHTTLPAKLAFGMQPFELSLRVGDEAPDLQFVVEIISVGKDSVGRCIAVGRGLELGRLPEGTVVHRVDRSRPLTCRVERR